MFIQNAGMALGGGVLVIVLMILGYKFLDALTRFNTSAQLQNGNVAVGIYVAGILLALAVAMGQIVIAAFS